MESLDWNGLRMTMLCIRWGIAEFLFIVSLAFTSQMATDICLRGSELRVRRLGQIRKHWKFAIATVVVLFLSWMFQPTGKAETIIEHQDQQGNITATEVYRTPKEQAEAEFQYVNPKDGSTMVWYDPFTNRPTTRDQFEASMEKLNQRTIDVNNEILDGAREWKNAGKMSEQEFQEHYGRIQVMNNGAKAWIKSIRDENAPNKFQPDSMSTPQRQIKIIERKVLVSG